MPVQNANFNMFQAQKSIKILGLSFFYHDSAAALIVDGYVVAACQEERFTRKKHDASFPKRAASFCLAHAALDINAIDYVVFYEKPLLKFERLLTTYIRVWPRGLASFIYAMTSLFGEKQWIEQKIRQELGYRGPVLYTEHHYAHAASAYYASNFDDAAVVTMDGVGEFDTVTVGYASGNTMRLIRSIHFPHSLGLLYSAVTYYLGFKVNSAEYKVMGLAPYGNPGRYLIHFKKLIEIYEDGSFHLNMRYFAYEYGLTMTNKNFDMLFGGPPRDPEAALTQHHKDIAAALQKITEEVVLRIVAYAKNQYPSTNLCLAGGVALNCVANGKILEQKLFEHIYIQPASGDAGGAVGAALYIYYDVLGNQKQHDTMPNVFLGTAYTNDEIQKTLDENKAQYRELSDQELIVHTARLIAEDNVIGWFQGRMEFGPRALGARSIIADARNKANWQRVNLKIKFRESFRPFAPTVLEEHTQEYFDLSVPSPYMLLVANVKKDTIPAVTHVDGSARIQTIRRENHALYYDMIQEFYRISGCPVIINTSFNVRGEPIVESPEDAFRCFINTYMDYLIIGNFIVAKKDNMRLVDSDGLKKYLGGFSLD